MAGTYYLTILPETSKLGPGIRKALVAEERNLKLSPAVDTSGAQRAGRDAGRAIISGVESSGSADVGRMLRTDGARMAGARAGSEINAGLASANIGAGTSAQIEANVTRGATGIGHRLGSAISTGLKASAAAAGVGFTALIGGALTAGMRRLTAIDEAKFKLQGLGNSTEQVTSIIEDAKRAVLGTAYSLDEAATTAASAVAAGIKPGEQLNGYLRLTADAAAIAGTSMAEMGSIFNAVQTSGKAFTAELRMLADRGLPVFTWLEQATGKAGEELQKFIEKGGVSAELFRQVIAANISGASTEMGKSVTGTLQNLKAAYSRFGAELSGPAFAMVLPFAQAFTKVFDAVTAQIKPIMERITAQVQPWAERTAGAIQAWFEGGGLERVVDWFRKLGDSIARFTQGDSEQAFTGIKDSISGLGDAFRNAGPAVTAIGVALGGLGQAIIQAGPETISAIMVPAANLLAGALRFLADNANWAVPTIIALGGAFLGLRAVGNTLTPIINLWNSFFQVVRTPLILAQTAAIRQQAAAMDRLSAALGTNTVAQNINAQAQARNTAATTAGAAAQTRGRVATFASTIATRAQAVALRAVAAAQWVFNAALRANPIGLIVTAVAGLGAALWAFFTKTETGRKIWNTLWNGIKAVATPVIEWIKEALGKLWQNIQPGLQRLGEIARTAFGAIGNALKAVWNFVQPAVSAIGNFYKSLLSAELNIAVNLLKGLGSTVLWLWRNVFVPAWQGIGAAIKLWWSGAQVVWNAFSAAIRTVGDAMVWLWRNVFEPAWNGIKAGIGAAWEFIKGVFEKITGGFATLRDRVGAVAGAIKDAVTGAFSGLAEVIKTPLRALGSFLAGIPGEVLGIPIPGAETLQNWGRNLQGLATGGRVRGPGSGTSDSIIARLSNGEFVVNAAQTARWLPLLQAINDGTIERLLPAFAGGGLTAHASEVKDYIHRVFGIKEIGGWRPPDRYNEHSTGNALDVMIPNWQSPQGKALGDAIVGWAIKNAAALGLTGVIWRQTSYGYGGSFTTGKPMPDRGSPTQNHMDHVHIFMNNPPDKRLRIAGPTYPSSVGGSVSATGYTYSNAAGGAAAGYRPATEKELQSSADRVYNAQKSVREAQQSVDDAEYRLEKARKRLEEARAKGKRVEDAERSVAVAERELADANERLSRARDKAARVEAEDTELRTKGKPDKRRTKGKPDKRQSGGDDSKSGPPGSDFSELGRTFVSGILETLGLDGSIFSNPLEWPTVKSAMAGVNFLGGLGKLAMSRAQQDTGEETAAQPGIEDTVAGGFAGVADAVGVGELLSPTGASSYQEYETKGSGSPQLLPGQYNPAATGVNSVAGATGPGDVLSAFAPMTQGGVQQQPQQIDNSINIEGPVGMDPSALRSEIRAEQNQRMRTTVRYTG